MAFNMLLRKERISWSINSVYDGASLKPSEYLAVNVPMQKKENSLAAKTKL